MVRGVGIRPMRLIRHIIEGTATLFFVALMWPVLFWLRKETPVAEVIWCPDTDDYVDKEPGCGYDDNDPGKDLD